MIKKFKINDKNFNILKYFGSRVLCIDIFKCLETPTIEFSLYNCFHNFNEFIVNHMVQG